MRGLNIPVSQPQYETCRSRMVRVNKTVKKAYVTAQRAYAARLPLQHVHPAIFRKSAQAGHSGQLDRLAAYRDKARGCNIKSLTVGHAVSACQLDSDAITASASVSVRQLVAVTCDIA